MNSHTDLSHQSSTSPARPVARPTPNSIRARTVSTSSPATHAGPVAPSRLSRLVSRPRSVSVREWLAKSFHNDTSRLYVERLEGRITAPPGRSKGIFHPCSFHDVHGHDFTRSSMQIPMGRGHAKDKRAPRFDTVTRAVIVCTVYEAVATGWTVLWWAVYHHLLLQHSYYQGVVCNEMYGIDCDVARSADGNVFLRYPKNQLASGCGITQCHAAAISL